MICNAAHYDAWPADVRIAVAEAAAMATAYQHQLAAAEDAVILAKIDPSENEITELTPPEYAAFVTTMQPVLAKISRAARRADFRSVRGLLANIL